MILSVPSEKQYVNFLLRICLITLLILFSIGLLVPKGMDVLTINGMHSPFLDSFFITLTNFGNALIFLPLALWAMLFELRISLMVALTGAFHGIVISLAKRLLFPFMSRPTAILDHDLLYFVPNVDVHSRYSFPSGHAATIFAAAILICLVIKRKDVSILLLMFAVLVGLSRIYLLQHFLQDVIGGAIVGIASAYASFAILHPNKKWPAWMNQRIKIHLSNPGRKSESLSPGS